MIIHRIGFHEMLQAVIGPMIDIPRMPLEPGTLLSDLRLDVLDRATIAVELDEAYGIEIPDADIESWLTLADIAATLKRLAPQEDYQPEGHLQGQPKGARA